MKKFGRMLFCAAVFALTLALLTACAGPKWELGASVENKTVAPGENFTVTVTTKNVGGDFKCDHQTKDVGAAPSLYLDIGAGRVYLAFDMRATTDEVRKVTFAGGEAVTIKWTFRANTLETGAADGMAAPAGKYTLKLTFLGTEKIIEDFLEIKVA